MEAQHGMDRMDNGREPQHGSAAGRTVHAPCDVLGLGVVAVDDILLAERYPPADSKARVLHRERQCGGLTATALVAAARMGSRCAYAGMLGDDELSRFALEKLTAAGIDLAHSVRRPDASPVHSTIIVDASTGTRNIFWSAGGLAGAHPDLPPPELILSSRVLFVDHWGLEGMIRAARVARTAGIPVVADIERADEPRISELLDLVDHVIVSRDFALRWTGAASAEAAAVALWRPDRSAVIVTVGEQGCHVVTGDDARRAVRHRAFSVDAVDTTGCGDVFHGAYASALARGLGLAARIEFAAAAAALKAMRPGGQAGIPDRETIEAFLGSRK